MSESKESGFKLRFWLPFRNRVLDSIGNWQMHRDQNSLEKALARIIETANGHQAKGLPKGSPAYVVLNRLAKAKIDDFCCKWSVDICDIEAEAPALKELYALAIPDRQIPPFIKLIAAFTGGILFLFLIGAGSGVVSVAHNFVMHLFAH